MAGARHRAAPWMIEPRANGSHPGGCFARHRRERQGGEPSPATLAGESRPVIGRPKPLA